MSTKSKQKGKRGEIEAAKIMTELTNATWQREGNFGEDIICDKDTFLHVEVKRRERLNIHAAMDQSQRYSDKNGDTLPIVLHRKNNHDWLVTVKFNDLEEFAREILRLIDE